MPQFRQERYQLGRGYHPDAFDFVQFGNPFIVEHCGLPLDRLLHQLYLRCKVLEIGFQEIGDHR
ncbi:hypothetical protein D3C77_411370 [compost metagenome]